MRNRSMEGFKESVEVWKREKALKKSVKMT